jgi:hypothetical protein
LLTESEFK